MHHTSIDCPNVEKVIDSEAAIREPIKYIIGVKQLLTPEHEMLVAICRDAGVGDNVIDDSVGGRSSNL
jgi:hypothetical protein